MSKKRQQPIITGNWKMHKTIEESVEFVHSLAPAVKTCSSLVYLAVPFTAIHSVAEAAKETPLVIGAQNMNDASEGAFTGEIAAKMIKEAGAQFVILGHSERRQLFKETSEIVSKKVQRAIEEGIQPILCVGETLAEREAGKAEEVLADQIRESLLLIKKNNLDSLILAYEPVWAIGTGHSATPKQAQEMHKFCRSCIAEQFGEEAASHLSIQYGGSVTPQNTKELLDQPDIDGLLVGGASLSSQTFSQIINYEP